MSIERHKKREHGSNEKEDKEKGIQGEMIQNRNNGKECDQRKKWSYKGSKPENHKKMHENIHKQWETWKNNERKSKSNEKKNDGSDLKRQRKKKRKSTGEKENKKKGKETHGNKWKCVECEKECDSLEKINKHIHENECGGWICCEEHLRKQRKNEEKYMKKDECTKTIKEPDIAKGVIEND